MRKAVSPTQSRPLTRTSNLKRGRKRITKTPIGRFLILPLHFHRSVRETGARTPGAGEAVSTRARSARMSQPETAPGLTCRPRGEAHRSRRQRSTPASEPGFSLSECSGRGGYPRRLVSDFLRIGCHRPVGGCNPDRDRAGDRDLFGRREIGSRCRRRDSRGLSCGLRRRRALRLCRCFDLVRVLRQQIDPAAFPGCGYRRSDGGDSRCLRA